MSTAPENVSLGDMVRDVLLAVVSSQNEANKNFVADIEDLAATDVTIGYSRNVEGKKENREIRGNALAFGVLPTLLSIQSSTIEIRTALSVTKNASANKAAKNVRERAEYLFKTNTVDAKYQNTYSYKAESSSIIRITVVPTPPSQALLEAIKALAVAAPIADNPKP
jgi:subtilase family serine protease